MTPRSSNDSKSSWTDEAIVNKLEELRRLCLDSDKPDFFPQTLIEFCEWTDESKNIKAFTRPVLYKKLNNQRRDEAQSLIRAGIQRWSATSTGDGARIRDLETLTKMLTSRYHQERQHRIDAQRESSALRASVDSLNAKLRELTGSRSVKLVTRSASKGD
ncbi:hypothetical protein [Roseateles koreensis]|uniref:Uncharacterized protein n=1 Tax=Roseateles koreensis TaxID=2987526 RepID=A0ABT5KSV0_9BURK|nr:hypothetical protein [Roseateles koreensis]MDC8785999.1 hypothetical protein [Roseateles koreensis]